MIRIPVVSFCILFIMNITGCNYEQSDPLISLLFKTNIMDVHTVTFTPDNSILIGGVDNFQEKGVIKNWSLDSGSSNILYHDEDSSEFIMLNISPDGKYLLSARRNIVLWDISAGKKINTLLQDAYLRSASFSPNGEKIATFSNDLIVRVWDIKSGQIVKTFPIEMSRIYGVRFLTPNIKFSPDGKYIAVSDKIWEYHSGQIHINLADRNKAFLDFNSDGSYFVYTYHTFNDKQPIIISEFDTGSIVHIFYGHDSSITSGQFCPNDKYLLSTSFDNTVRLWDIETGENLFVFDDYDQGGFTKLGTASFNYDGGMIVLTTDENNVRVYSNPYGPELYKDYYNYKITNAEANRLNRNFDAILEERIAADIDKLRSPRGEFETTKQYEKRIKEADDREVIIRNEAMKRLSKEIDSLQLLAINFYEDWEKEVNIERKIDIIIGDYNADEEYLEITIEETREKIKLFLELDRAPSVVEKLRKGLVETKGNYRILEDNTLSIKTVSIKDPTGGQSIVYNSLKPAD